MAHDVFISYSSRNKPVADAICAGLEAEKLRCWIAPRDVLPGHNYGESIVHAIAGCRVMVLVFSEATNVSQAVIREAERAMHNNKPIIPFRIEDTPMSPGLEFFLASCHWLDAINPPMDEHIAHLARSVRALTGETEYVAEKVTPAPPGVRSFFLPWVIAGVAAMAVLGGFFVWNSGRKPAVEVISNHVEAASSGLALAVSLAGSENGAISSHFSASPCYQSSEADGVLVITTLNTPPPGRITVVSPAGDGRWLALPHAGLDLKLINNGSHTAFFQRAVLNVTSSIPETKAVWLVDGTRLPKILAVRPLGGVSLSAPNVSVAIAGPEDVIDQGKLPPSLAGIAGKGGSWEFLPPRGPASGLEETLFGKVDDIPFEIPFAAIPAARHTPPGKPPEPLYEIKLRESGENYTVACDLSQYVQAGEGDRFFLRLESPVIARHRFTLTLEYDDGSGGNRILEGPTVDASLFPGS